ncbi:GIY-YIG nuclease family protein [Halorubrum amylolyticum]|uniref:GIY-YIG nuclease family protein n=1 Tax=Halorubrum amylolyticum TaxID=2508724 RepID=UPI0010086E75|nr:GIY-YIG nuclease family protein [Halorubrum amylolyticum]
MSGDGGGDGDEAENDANDPDGGTYTLLVALATPATIEVGALGARRFDPGGYAYTGSALGAGGFSRVDRHRRTARGDHDVRHWHVDHLLGHPDTRIDRVVRSVGADVECAVADRLPAGPVDGFGASDCGCGSHLAAAGEGESLDEFAARVREAHGDAVAETGGSVDVVAGSAAATDGAVSDVSRTR